MLKEKQIEKFQRKLYELYHKEHGDSVSPAFGWSFSFSIVAENESLMRLMKEYFGGGDKLGDGLEHIFEELRSRSWIGEHPDGSHFLTMEGIEIGSQTRLQRFVSYFNKNPGISTLIAAGAFVVSLLALYISLVEGK